MVGVAAVNIPGTNQTYVFKGDEYIRYEWTPGAIDDRIVYGPRKFASEWPALKEVGFSQIDAILPIHGHQNRAYFFYNDKYVRIEYVPGTAQEKILGGVRSIADNWASLKQAGFKHVDAAYNVPGRPGEAYFFCGYEYCHVSFTEGSSSNDKLIWGPKQIDSAWKAMTFSAVDTFIPVHGSENDTYVFSGNRYARIKAIPGGSDELITGPKEIAPYWPGLHKAGFY